MTVRAQRLRLRRCEFPTVELARPHGKTHFAILPTARKLLAYLWFELNRRD